MKLKPNSQIIFECKTCLRFITASTIFILNYRKTDGNPKELCIGATDTNYERWTWHRLQNNIKLHNRIMS